MNPSPLQEIFPPDSVGVRVFLKRDDLLHPLIHGNKWRKLRPIIQQNSTEKTGLLSFGGAFSNHLHALASAGKLFGFPTMGIVRGLSADLTNPTLQHARDCGMQLFPVSKSDYEILKKAALPQIFQVLGIHPEISFQLLPEGGDTPEAVVSCATISAEILHQLPSDAGKAVYFCVPAGTGCTAAGVIAGAGPGHHTLVFPAAPYGVDRAGIRARLTAVGFDQDVDFQIMDNMAPPKFAQMTEELLAFIRVFEQKEAVLLDPVYTSRMMCRLYELLAQQFFPPGSCVVALHTGGLQGWDGMFHRPNTFTPSLPISSKE